MHTTNLVQKKVLRNLPAILCMIVILICMVVSQPVSAATSTSPVTINAVIKDEIPIADFYGDPPLSGPSPLTISFHDRSQGYITSWHWEFGDGTISDLQNPPSHTYFIGKSYTVNLTVSNSAGFSTKSINNYITVNSPTITLSPASPLPPGTVGSPYSQTITAIGGTGPYTFSVPPGTLPAGLTLSSGGVISGNPTTAGTYSFTITATDFYSFTGLKVFDLAINPAITITTASPLPAGTVGTLYTQTFAATGGTGGPYTFSLATGSALPPDLTLSTAGVLSGIPTAVGPYPSFTITVSDGSATGSKTFDLAINPAITLSPTNPNLPAGDAGTAYPAETAITASGGTEPYKYTVTSGKLPEGLTLDPDTGIISGILDPTAVTSTFTITATDSATIPHIGSQTYTITVNPLTLTPPPPPTGESGTTNSGLDFSPVFAFVAGITEQATGQEGAQSIGSPLNVDLTGANVKVDGNIVTVKTSTLTIVYVVDKISQDVDSISVSTPSQEADIEGVGHVSASVEASLESILGNATINITLEKPEQDVMDILYRAMEAENREIQAIAYTMTVNKTNITANLPAKIYMNCTKEWVDLNAPNGDPAQVSIIRIADDQTTQVLPTTWSYDEATGMYHFVGLSKDGLSVFGLVTAKATVTEKAENPNATVVVASKSMVSTNVGMYEWLLSTLEQNPVILVIVLAVVAALVAYFGWWKRRL